MAITRRAFLAAAAPRRPLNVLVFMSDQESALLPGPANLPNRRRLLSRGIEFSNAFCNTPQCSPGRAALLTGREPHQAGVLTNVDGGSLGKPLNPQVETIGRTFQRAGYSTGYFGKWHLGNERKGLGAFGFSQALTRGTDGEFAGAAVDWIRQQTGPWLAWVSVLDPHHIYDAPRVNRTVTIRPGVRPPSSDLSNLAGKPAEQRWFADHDQGRATAAYKTDDWLRYRSFYLELVEKVDGLLGQVLRAVPFESTVVAYTSDHGDALGEHGLPFKGPFLYEELIRIPLILSVPGFKTVKRDDLVTQADLAPTLAGLAGAGRRASAGGRNLTSESPHKPEIFLEYYAKQKHVNPIRSVRTPRWKLNWYDSGHKEMYDLSQDPHEKTNLADETAVRQVQSHLETKLNGWRAPLTPRPN